MKECTSSYLMLPNKSVDVYTAVSIGGYLFGGTCDSRHPTDTRCRLYANCNPGLVEYFGIGNLYSTETRAQKYAPTQSRRKFHTSVEYHKFHEGEGAPPPPSYDGNPVAKNAFLHAKPNRRLQSASLLDETLSDTYFTRGARKLIQPTAVGLPRAKTLF